MSIAIFVRMGYNSIKVSKTKTVEEMKENNLIETLKANLEEMTYSDYNIHAGID